jgi:hypothetical protein
LPEVNERPDETLVATTRHLRIRPSQLPDESLSTELIHGVPPKFMFAVLVRKGLEAVRATPIARSWAGADKERKPVST